MKHNHALRMTAAALVLPLTAAAGSLGLTAAMDAIAAQVQFSPQHQISVQRSAVSALPVIDFTPLTDDIPIGTDIRIEASVTSDTAVESVQVHYDMGSGWQTETMSLNTFFQRYTFSLSPGDFAGTFRYYISATDTAGNTAFAGTEDDPFYFTIGAAPETVATTTEKIDTNAPYVQVNNAPRTFYTGDSFVISAIIRDEAGYESIATGVESATFFYKQTDAPEYTAVPLTVLEGDTYSLMLAPDVLTDDAYVYYIEAVDFAGNIGTFSSADEPTEMLRYDASTTVATTAPLITTVTSFTTTTAVTTTEALTTAEQTTVTEAPATTLTETETEAEATQTTETAEETTPPEIPDSTPPVIIHAGISSANYGEELYISVDAEDPQNGTQTVSGLHSLTLYYKTDQTAYYTSRLFEFTPGTAQGTASFQLDAPIMETATVSYYFEAEDEAGNKSSTREYFITVSALAGLQPGDVNGDGILDSEDVTVMRRALAGGWPDNPLHDEAADYNADGSFDLKDVVLLRRALENAAVGL